MNSSSIQLKLTPEIANEELLIKKVKPAEIIEKFVFIHLKFSAKLIQQQFYPYFHDHLGQLEDHEYK